MRKTRPAGFASGGISVFGIIESIIGSSFGERKPLNSFPDRRPACAQKLQLDRSSAACLPHRAVVVTMIRAIRKGMPVALS
jgi:hypothetical protein